MENQNLSDVEVTPEAATQLTEASRWGKFYGIFVLAGTGLCFLLVMFLWKGIVGRLMVRDEMDERNIDILRIVMVFVFLCAAVVVAVLMGFLIKGAARIRRGIRDRDQQAFNSGLANLRSYFIMTGVLAIIGLFFTLLGLLVR